MAPWVAYHSFGHPYTARAHLTEQFQCMAKDGDGLLITLTFSGFSDFLLCWVCQIPCKAFNEILMLPQHNALVETHSFSTGLGRCLIIMNATGD